eukprot:g10162.t1
MKLELRCRGEVHTEMVTAVAWTPDNELYSMSDDNTIHRWDGGGDPAGKVAGLDAYVTSVSWFPNSGSKKQTSDVFAAACSDGTVRLITRAGREEKKVSAHTGAVVCVRWSPDGSALCSCGEDGDVKARQQNQTAFQQKCWDNQGARGRGGIWSRSGNLRSTLMQTGHSLYALAWSPDSESVVVGAGRDLAIKGVQAGQKQLRWPAHEGLVIAVDWNMVNDLLLSGGEDCTYRVWDRFGRQMYQSGGLGYTITGVKWCPNGESFAVGAFNTLRLCDKTGWSHSRDRPQSGSLTSLVWTPDGTQLAAAGGNGSVVFGQVIERSIEWDNFEAVLVSPSKIKVSDVGSDVVEELDFSACRVVEMSLAFGHLLAATHNQVFIYSVTNWNTPHILDMRGATSLIVQAETHFLTLDNSQGVESAAWSDKSDVLTAIADGRLITWYYPNAVAIDRDLLGLASTSRDAAEFGKIRLFRWSRALELAVQHKTHVDTVLGYRQAFLKEGGKEETDKRFLQFASEVPVDWEVITAKKEKEREDEHGRAGTLPRRGAPSSGMDREMK